MKTLLHKVLRFYFLFINELMTAKLFIKTLPLSLIEKI